MIKTFLSSSFFIVSWLKFRHSLHWIHLLVSSLFSLLTSLVYLAPDTSSSFRTTLSTTAAPTVHCAAPSSPYGQLRMVIFLAKMARSIFRRRRGGKKNNETIKQWQKRGGTGRVLWHSWQLLKKYWGNFLSGTGTLHMTNRILHSRLRRFTYNREL